MLEMHIVFDLNILAIHIYSSEVDYDD